MAAALRELFPTEVRHTGISVAYQFGGSAPFFASLIIAGGGSIFWVSVYMAVGLVLSHIAVLTMRKTNDTDLVAIDQAPAVKKRVS
ncbi:MAG: transporter [Subtercola sp.]|nr:transporter [Subtercola sp.]